MASLQPNVFDAGDYPSRRSLSDDVVERLREAISNGTLQPGQRLREEQLGDLLKVSRGPIREALVKLEREGLVIKEPNRSAVVAHLSREDLEEVYSLRQTLEQLAMRQAVRKAKPDQLNAMQRIIDTMAAYLERGITQQEAAALDIQFHEIIYQSAEHRRLYECWSTLRPQIHIFLLQRTVANNDFRDHMLSSHQALLDALKGRNEAQAIRLINDHIEAAYLRIMQSSYS